MPATSVNTSGLRGSCSGRWDVWCRPRFSFHASIPRTFEPTNRAGVSSDTCRFGPFCTEVLFQILNFSQLNRFELIQSCCVFSTDPSFHGLTNLIAKLHSVLPEQWYNGATEEWERQNHKKFSSNFFLALKFIPNFYWNMIKDRKTKFFWQLGPRFFFFFLFKWIRKM